MICFFCFKIPFVGKVLESRGGAQLLDGKNHRIRLKYGGYLVSPTDLDTDKSLRLRNDIEFAGGVAQQVRSFLHNILVVDAPSFPTMIHKGCKFSSALLCINIVAKLRLRISHVSISIGIKTGNDILTGITVFYAVEHVILDYTFIIIIGI